jgi:malate synthase
MRHWISLIKHDENGRPQVYLDDKDYTAKSGEDYFLNCCYTS